MGRMLTTKALQGPVSRRVPQLSVKPSPRGALPSFPVAPQAPATSQKSVRSSNLPFYFGLALIFTVFGVLTELMYFVTGINTYLIYVVSPAAILATVLAGGIQRTLQSRTAWYWIGFSLLMIVGIPFSSWTGGSWGVFYNYVRVCLPLLFVIGGLATNWKELRAIFNTIAMAGILNLLTIRLFAKEENGRLSMDASGTIGNSNDLAAHLSIILPFLLFISMDRTRNRIIRLAMLPLLAYGVWAIVGTASRGAVIALGVIFLFVLAQAKPKQRITALVVAVVLVVASITLLPSVTLNRLGTLFGQEDIEANESTDARSYLFQKSVRYSLEHPLLGVGVGQFSTFEGKESQAKGEHGSWHETHCAWTQISSECGIPALIFVLMAIGSALMLVFRAWRQARKRAFPEIANACFCYLVAMVGFLVTITFIADAYRIYLPAMIGLAIAINFVATKEMSASTTTNDRRFTGMLPSRLTAVR
jgi:O-antigen ligase